MKRKTLTLAISVFALLAIISVGFASWVITRQDQTAPVEGSITVDNVTDNNLGISYEWVTDINGNTKLEGNPQIVFGKPASQDDISSAIAEWLSPSDKTENLHAYLKISVANTAKLDSKTVTISFKAVKTVDQQETEIASNEYFTLPDATQVVNFDGKASIVVDLAFAWGQKFGKVNPLNVAAPWTGSYTPSNADLANAALSGLYDALNGVTYKVTITAVDK